MELLGHTGDSTLEVLDIESLLQDLQRQLDFHGPRPLLAAKPFLSATSVFSMAMISHTTDLQG